MTDDRIPSLSFRNVRSGVTGQRTTTAQSAQADQESMHAIRQMVLHWEGGSLQEQSQREPRLQLPAGVDSPVAVMTAPPQRRVMSPSLSPGFSTTACSVCRGALHGPLVSCRACGAYVHSQCSVGLLQDSFCEHCVSQWRLAEEAQHSRELQQQAARRLGFAGARGSELLGTAFGAVSAASAAATRYFVAGAHAGARSAWQGSTQVPPPAGLELHLQLLASLPPPLPADPGPATAPSVSEGAERREQGRERERKLRERHRNGRTGSSVKKCASSWPW